MMIIVSVLLVEKKECIEVGTGKFFFGMIQELRVVINDGNRSTEKMFIESMD